MSRIENLRQPTPQELDTFRASLPACDQRDEFSLLNLWWDVVKARWILAQWPRPIQSLSVPGWAKGYRYDQLLAHPEPEYGPPDERGFREVKMPFVLVYVDPKQALRDEIDLTQPVIVAEIGLPNGQETQIFLDGHKRLYKALASGLQTIPAFLLSREEAELCRIH
jgi:hypothetical protein